MKETSSITVQEVIRFKKFIVTPVIQSSEIFCLEGSTTKKSTQVYRRHKDIKAEYISSINGIDLETIALTAKGIAGIRCICIYIQYIRHINTGTYWNRNKRYESNKR